MILQTAARHGATTLADTWLAVIAHDSNRVMLYYLTKIVDLRAEATRDVINETLPLIRSNLDILKLMMPLFSMSKSLYEASANMVRQSGLGDQIDVRLSMIDMRNGSNGIEGPTAPGTPVQSTPEWVLNPLAIYRLARKAVPEREKHAPELHQSPEARATAPDAAASSLWKELSTSSQSGRGVQNTFVDSDGFTFGSIPRSVPVANSDASFDDLQMFFSSDFDTVWQPADTFLESSHGGGIAPWESEARPRTSLGTGELDMFMPNYSWPLSEPESL